jgi:hypothetical protein
MRHFTFLITKIKSIALLICCFCIYLQSNAQFLSIPFASNIGIGCNFTGIKNNSYIKPDYTYSAIAASDDGFQYIPLPFLFNFKGKKYDHIYINNNGSISMTAGISSYVSSPFPIASLPYPIIAPFMADVDTRDYPFTKGVKYKISPHRIIVSWDSVAAYDVVWFGPSFSNPGPRNSFQIILSDGTDTLVGIGKNVAIRYGKMQWTFGAASANQHAGYGYQLGDNVNYCNFTGSMTQVQMSYHLDSMSVTGSLLTVLNIAKDSCPSGISTNGGLHAVVANSAVSSYTYNLSSSVIGFTPVTNTTGIFTSLPKAFYTVKATNAFLDTLTKVFNLGSNTVYYDTACFTFTTSWGDAVYSSGTYNHTYSSIVSCDSVVTHHVFLNNSYPTSITQNTDAGQCSAIVNYNPPVATCNNVTPILLFGGASGSTFPKGINAVIYGTPYDTATYNFNALTSGISINAQDGWLGSSAGFFNNSTTQVSNATPFANPQSSGLGLLATAVGANKTSFASRVDNANFSIPNVDANGIMTIQFDARQTYWGNALQFGFDANANGYLSGANEISFGVRYSVVNNNISLVGAGGVVLASVSSSSYSLDPRWRQFKLTIDKNANAGAGSLSLSFRDIVNNGAWMQPLSLQNITAGFNPLATDASNLTNLNAMVYEHEAGNGGTENSFLDNIIFILYSKCSFTINVIDNELPVITCPANIFINAPVGLCNAATTFATPTFSDNCANASMAYLSGFYPSGYSFPIGVSTNVFQVTDASGNTNTCAHTITVNDNQAPTIICPSNIVTNVTPGTCGKIANYATPIGLDNCSGATTIKITGGASDGNFFRGVTAVVYQVTDASSNSSSCLFTVTVTDNQAPSITCPANIVANITSNTCATNVSYAIPIITDNCSGVTSLQTAGLASGVSCPKGVTTNVFQVTDASGNTNSCSFSVTVNDIQNPIINCPSNITQANDNNVCGATINYTITSTDNCPGETVTQTAGLASGSIFPIGTTTNSFKVTDASGNIATCNFMVTITDAQLPTITCNTFAIVNATNTFGEIEATSPLGAVVNFSLPTASDNCSSVSVVANPTSGSQFAIGLNTVTITAIDANNNASNCTASIVVVDKTPPLFTGCPSNIFVNVVTGCNAFVSWIPPTVIDMVDQNPVVISNFVNGSSFPIGATTVTYTAYDTYGNASNCSFVITVIDNISPTITCPANIAGNTQTNLCSAIINYTSPIGVDNCTNVTVVQTAGLASGVNFPIGVTTNVFQVTDASGNASSCSFTVTIIDNQLPIITCPANISVMANNANCIYNGAIGIAIATDNCLGTIITNNAPLLIPAGVNIYTHTAIDASGNVASCLQTITVNKLPVVVVAHSATTLFTNDVVNLKITSPTGGISYWWAGAGGLASATDDLIEKVSSVNTGIYTASVIDAFGCNISTTISIAVNASIVVSVKALLSGPYITSAGLMQDSLRVKNMIPTKEPYGSLPYAPIFTHATNSNIGIDCTDPILLSNASLVTGGDAIVDWVFLQVRQASDPSIVLASRSALLQRDGDVVREDGISPVTFQGIAPDNYFISIKHRTHLGLMNNAAIALSETPTSIDFTDQSNTLYTRPSPNNNTSPLTGATRIMGGKRAMYTGNCNIASTAYSRFITYNNTINSDRTSMIGTVGNTGTITGYSIFDIDMNGYARFNGLHPDRIVLLLNCVNNSSIYLQEQTPN